MFERRNLIHWGDNRRGDGLLSFESKRDFKGQRIQPESFNQVVAAWIKKRLKDETHQDALINALHKLDEDQLSVSPIESLTSFALRQRSSRKDTVLNMTAEYAVTKSSQSTAGSQEEGKWPWPPHERLFLSSNGNFGLVPPEVQEGDLVCQFLGCEIAVVLRKEGTRIEI
jgi:hypothetical protein